MELIKPKERLGFSISKDYDAANAIYIKLLDEIAKHNPDDSIVAEINKHTADINRLGNKIKPLLKQYKGSQSAVVHLVEKKLKLAPINYYHDYWYLMGLLIYGVPIGIGFGLMFDNMGFLGLGLAIGFVLGMAMGTKLDEKAQAEGRQLDVEIKNL